MEKALLSCMWTWRSNWTQRVRDEAISARLRAPAVRFRYHACYAARDDHVGEQDNTAC